MDKDSRELAVYAFGMLNEQLSPMYLQARSEFLGHLATSGATQENLQMQHAHEVANREIITRFCEQLPGAIMCTERDSYGRPYTVNSKLASNDPAELATQQASVVFVNMFLNKAWRKLPYYVVGIDNVSRKVLLAPPNFLTEEDDELANEMKDQVQDELLVCTFDFSKRYARRHLGKITSHLDALKSLYTTDPDEYAREKFDRSSGQFVANAFSPGSLGLEQHAERASYLSDEELLAYGVNDHLSRLALTFNKGDSFIRSLKGEAE